MALNCLVSSAIFAGRNVDKAQHGEIGRAPVAACQGLKVFNEVRKYDNMIGRGTQKATNIFSELAKDSKFIDNTGKIVKWGVNHVNPLICVSGGLKVAMSDDKVNTAINQAGALSGMFAGEALFKNHYDSIAKTKLFKPVFEGLEKTKIGGKFGAIIKGVLFVSTSIGAYSLGEHMTKDTAKSLSEKIGVKIQQKNEKKELAETIA